MANTGSNFSRTEHQQRFVSAQVANGRHASGRQGLEECSEASQPVLGPRGPQLLVSREFPTGGGGFRGSDSSAFLRRERHWRLLVVITGKPENHVGYVVLCGRRQVAGCLNRLIEQFSHH